MKTDRNDNKHNNIHTNDSNESDSNADTTMIIIVMIITVLLLPRFEITKTDRIDPQQLKVWGLHT